MEVVSSHRTGGLTGQKNRLQSDREVVSKKMEPSPIMMKGNRETDRPYRKVDCDHYGKCLDVALKSRWSDFSCAQCGAYSRTRFIEQASGSDDYW
ncbi:MAG: hypothetical protein FJ118_11855 [Deltaproteobacteria bacterium]|nr:hypothetical protein [Deltaproteobacteria bacterium]